MRIKRIIIFCIPLLLILYYYKNLLLNLGTHMTGWYDGPFVIWIFQNNIRHFASLDFRHLFETNAMYPFSDSLSFTDHMFFPSLIALLISFFNKNPIFQFNLITVLNHLLVYISFYILSSRFSKNSVTRMLASFFSAFSPYLIGQMGHLQMVIVWPIYLSLYYLLDPERKTKSLLLGGLFLGIQFHSSVYLGLMGLFVIILGEAVLALQQKKYRQALRESFIIVAVFILVATPSLYGYLRMQMNYHPQRGQEEFVNYSAHITDYFLVTANNSLFNKYIFNNSIGKLNQHTRGEMAAFIGIVPLTVILIWAFSKKKRIKPSPSMMIWLALLIISGIIFSLGPRANWNGKYLVFPLPYYFFLKLFPPVGIMRAVARWYFIVIFAVNILFIYSLDFAYGRIKNQLFKILFFPLLFFLLFVEFIPEPVVVTARNWRKPAYLYLQNTCKENPGAVLVYPFEYRYKFDNSNKYLYLVTNTLMSSTLYNCPTLSGFSSFEPPLYKEWQKEFDKNGITEKNIDVLKKNGFKYVMVNLEALDDKEKENPDTIIHTNDVKQFYRDNESIIFQIIK